MECPGATVAFWGPHCLRILTVDYTFNHDILLDKLEHFGIRDTEFFFFNYLMNRKQFVQIGDTESTTNAIKTAVPQGSILSPLIFTIYINDMPIASKYFAFIMYADDTTLVYTIKPQDFNNPQQLAAKIKKEIKLINN